jgi:hypothetical protein
MVNHEGKANRRFQRRVQAQSAVETEAPFVVEIARELRNDESIGTTF